MAYDHALADRIRELLLFEPEVVEKPMFGGLAFLLHGHIAVAVSGGGGVLMRAEPDEWHELLSQPSVEPFVMRGRPMRGWLRVGEEAVSEDEDLQRWVATGVDLARALPPAG